MKRYSCVYLTTYNGTKLPSYYIGSTYIENIEKGYKGSVTSKKWKSIWESELKNNPDLFTTEIIMEFTNRQDATDMEEIVQRSLNVVQSNEYINESFANKHFTSKGYKFTNAQKLKKSGKNHPLYGKHHSIETKRKIGNRDYSINSTDEFRQKVSKGMKKTISERGSHWTKGQVSHRKNTNVIEEYGPVKAYILKQKISNYAKERPKGTCIYCGVTMDVANLGKYHNKNCKKNKGKK